MFYIIKWRHLLLTRVTCCKLKWAINNNKYLRYFTSSTCPSARFEGNIGELDIQKVPPRQLSFETHNIIPLFFLKERAYLPKNGRLNTPFYYCCYDDTNQVFWYLNWNRIVALLLLKRYISTPPTSPVVVTMRN